MCVGFILSFCSRIDNINLWHVCANARACVCGQVAMRGRRYCSGWIREAVLELRRGQEAARSLVWGCISNGGQTAISERSCTHCTPVLHAECKGYGCGWSIWNCNLSVHVNSGEIDEMLQHARKYDVTQIQPCIVAKYHLT